MPVAGCTAILSGWFGRCLPMMIDEIFSSGITAAPTSHLHQSRRMRLRSPGWIGWRQNATSPNLRGDLETRRQDPVLATEAGELCTLCMGRPGPNSRANAEHAARLQPRMCKWFLGLCQGPLSSACSVGDTRVGGNLGRWPPEALSICHKLFTPIAKINDPFCRTSFGKPVCPLLTPRTSRMGYEHEFLPTPFLQWFVATGLFAIDGQDQATYLSPEWSPPDGSSSDPQACVAALSVLVSLHVALRRRRPTPHPWTCTRCRHGSYRRRPGQLNHWPFMSRMHARIGTREPTQAGGPTHVRGAYPTLVVKPTPAVIRILWVCSVCSCVTKAHSFPHGQEVSSPPNNPTSPMPSSLRAYGHLAVRLSAARKRAFKRAQMRTLRDGGTIYRGQRHDATSLSLRYIGQCCPRVKNPSPISSTPNLVKVVTWNCGGLHAGRYAELMAWMNSAQADPIHILMLQECHWPQSTEFHSDKWIHVYSGLGASQAGVMIVVNRQLAQPHQIRFAELEQGRILHVRLELDPPLDALCVYQHAWSTESGRNQPAQLRSTARAELLRKRGSVWQIVDNWVRSIPARNTLVLGGDMNASLQTAQPHVGLGVHPHTYPHGDQQVFQQMVAANGLIAMNTWRKAGKQSGTYLHMQHSVQIDYLLTRLPCSQASRKARAMHQEPIIHPTGMRHVPVMGYVPKPTKPRTPHTSHIKQHDVHCALKQQPELQQAFVNEVGSVLDSHPDKDLDECLQTAWRACANQRRPLSQKRTEPGAVSLQSFWTAKRRVRQLQQAMSTYVAPLVWYIATASAGSIIQAQPRVVRKLGTFVQMWRAVTQFHHQDRTLRRRVRQRKQQQIDELIQEAQELDGRGISALHLVAKRLRPRNPKRSIHLRDANGHLMSEQAELECLRTYFQQLFQSEAQSDRPHTLKAPFCIQQWEVNEALQSLPARKALPPGHAPAVLWKLARDHVGPRLCASFSRHLGGGTLSFPSRWHVSYLTLLAKPSKPPNCPVNLRPINLLPAEAKILARIAAARLRPLVIQATHMMPQFAYVSSRQCLDAIDRVLSHCSRIRELLRDQHRNAWRPSASGISHHAIGGLQLSLDLTKAYDRLPRPLLRAALERVGASEDLITLILYIHDSARILISRQNLEASVNMGRGVRQGCGLSPLLWICFTLLIHDRLSAYIPLEAQTSYADDFHLQWEFETEQGCRNACRTVPKVISELQALGMDVSLGKTVIIWAIKGAKASKLLQEFTTKDKGERVFQVTTPTGLLTLPLRRTHEYLGVKIGYHHFERDTVQHRLQLSWVAMHRLHSLLKHKLVHVRKRLLLWQSCVWSVAAYGIGAVGLDQASAQRLQSGIMRQIRIVARNPAHVSHVPNQQLLQQLGVTHPLRRLEEQRRKRTAQSAQLVGHLQPPRVHQWWSVLRSEFGLWHAQTPEPGILTEVTQILRIRSACPICGQHFPSKHALKVHIGKQHPEAQPRHEPNPTVKNQRKDEYRQFAMGGRPQCRFCLKKFYGWPQFMGHFSQNACPRLDLSTPPHQDATVKPRLDTDAEDGPVCSAPPAVTVLATSGAFAPINTEPADALAEPDPVPLFHRPALQELARSGKIRQLAQEIRESQLLNHCPECFQRVTRPAYLSRHAVKMHESVRLIQQSVEQWAQQRSGLTKPCQWCGDNSFTRHSLHLKACPVLWMVGHFLGRHSSLQDPGQAVLYGFRGRGAPGGSPGVRSIWGLHDQAGSPPGSSTGHTVSADLRAEQRSPSPRAGASGERDGGGPGEKDERRSARAGRGPAAQMGERRSQGRAPRRGRDRQGQVTGGGEEAADSQPGLQATVGGATQPGEQLGDAEQSTGSHRQSARSPTRLEADRALPAVAVQAGAQGSGLWRQRREQGGQGAEGAEGSGEGDGPPLVAIRGFARSDSPGCRIHHVSANGGVRQRVCHHTAAVRHSPPVESPERGTAGVVDEPDAEHPPLQPLQCVVDEARGHGIGPRADGQSSRQRMGRRDDVCVFTMGSYDPMPHQGPGAAGGASGCSTYGEDPEVLGHVPERCRQVPRPEENDVDEHRRGHRPLFLGGPEPDPGVTSDVHHHGPIIPQFDLALNRRDGQTCQTRPLAACQTLGPPSPSALNLQACDVQGVVLSNPSTHCYANAVVHSITWTAAGTPSGIPCADPALCRFLKWLARPLHLSRQRRPVSLWGTRSWVDIVQAWQEPDRQHDVGEFLQFLAPKLAIGHGRDRWQARELSEAHAVQVMDQGTLWPLTLTAPLVPLPQSADSVSCNQPVSLQKLVIQWRNQAARHAMLSEPAWLPVQVSRFDSQGHKTSRPVQISDAVYLPSFVGHTLQTTSHRYQLTAIIFHVGESLLAGHYRTALCANGSIVSITDDGMISQTASEADARFVYSNAYIFLLRKC